MQDIARCRQDNKEIKERQANYEEKRSHLVLGENSTHKETMEEDNKQISGETEIVKAYEVLLDDTTTELLVDSKSGSAGNYKETPSPSTVGATKHGKFEAPELFPVDAENRTNKKKSGLSRKEKVVELSSETSL